MTAVVDTHERVAATLPRVRRPSGDKAPLPKDVSTAELVALLAAGVAALAWLVAVATSHATGPPTAIDAAVVRAVADHRSEGLLDASRWVLALERNGVADIVTITLIVGLAWSRRLRRLIVFAIALVVIEVLVARLQHIVDWPRPFDIAAAARWEGYGGPSLAIAHLTAVLLGVVYGFLSLRRRTVGLVVTAVIVVAFGVASVYAGIAYPSDVLGGAGLATLLTVTLFVVVCPDAIFPVRSRRRTAAHLELTDERAELIEQAMAEQLGLRVLDIEPFAGTSSGGSAPLRLLVDSDPPRLLFGKLLTQQHVMSDRFYKLGRTLLYGRLEDETPHRAPRDLAQNEDYFQRVLRDAGAPVLASYGVVEVLPQREYLLVDQFVDDATELSVVDPPVPATLIDQGLHTVRVMWDSGVAHRDIKPANLLVRGEDLLLIDCGFAQVRPSPWRQAVDLANMMLSLALKSTPEQVYARALEQFSADDVAEAFAATASVTIPTQLRELLRADGRPLLDEFRSLAPARPPIRVQRWSVPRVALIGTTLLAALALVWGALGAFVWHDRGRIETPFCSSQSELQLVAQSVASARAVPCARTLPVGWRVALSRVDQHGTRVRFAGPRRSVTLALTRRCEAGSSSPTGERLRVAGRTAELYAVESGPLQREYEAALPGACASVVAVASAPADRTAAGARRDLDRLVQWVPRVFLDAALQANTHGRARHV